MFLIVDSRGIDTWDSNFLIVATPTPDFSDKSVWLHDRRYLEALIMFGEKRVDMT